MCQVIVVPETENFHFSVSHKNLVWTNLALGEPRLDDRDARYLGPLWLDASQVNRIFHILGIEVHEDHTEIRLGNSFILPTPWSNAGQHRRFEYHPLADFGLMEIHPGLLIPRPS